MELSDKDVIKLQAMYKEECGNRKPEGDGSSSDSSEDFLGWLLD